jgi:hypothetical protein
MQTEASRQIIGFSLPPELARTIKAEAAQRGISLKKLMEEFWHLYELENKRKSQRAQPGRS